MKKILYKIFLILSIQLMVSGCEDEFKLGEAPTQEDAVFTYTASEENDNIILFSNTSSGIKHWDFGNGSKLKGNHVRATYPTKGTYVVTLTIYGSGGTASSSQEIVIAETDASLLDIPVYNFLTGGADALEGKTWVMDKDRDGHFGIGPADGDWPEWYPAKANDKEGKGLYDDEITFKLDGFTLLIETQGDIYLNGAFASDFPEAVQEPDGEDFIAPYTAPANMTWSLVEVSEGKWQLNIAGGGFIGYYSGGATSYEVISLTENELYIRSFQRDAPGNAWYQRFIPKGYTPPVEEPEEPETSSLPINFEGTEPPFNGFNGSAYEVVDNPDASGINTSAKVGKYLKGTQDWSGILSNLDHKLDFSVSTSIKLKVYSPVTGKAIFKLESGEGLAEPAEVAVDITKANEWEELSFDFSTATSGAYDRIVLFFDYENNNGNTFYFDDIRLTAPGCNDEDEESLDPDGINFTVGSKFFGEFGGLVAGQVANPYSEGINTSCFVNSYIKTAGCEIWSGVGLLLDNPIDFGATTKKKFKLKVYAVDKATEVTLRLERLAHPDTEPSAERTAMITATGEWQELTFDFSDVTDPLTFKNVLIYFERNATCTGDTYYFDDLIQFE